MMKVVAEPFSGALVIEQAIFSDARGYFSECFKNSEASGLGITQEFVQDCYSSSVLGVVRGMHFTKKRPQSQFVSVLSGRIFDVIVDVRSQSSTFGQWFGAELGEGCPRHMYMSHGFAHGFCVLSEVAHVHYKLSQEYDPSDEFGFLWNDPSVGINWPVLSPTVSKRDQGHPLLRDVI